MNKREVFLSIGLFVLVFGFAYPVEIFSETGIKITGTYTNMHYNEEGGDILGEELRIVVGAKGYLGVDEEGTFLIK